MRHSRTYSGPSIEEIELGVDRVIEAAILRNDLGPQSPYYGMTLEQFRALDRPIAQRQIFTLTPRQQGVTKS